MISFSPTISSQVLGIARLQQRVTLLFQNIQPSTHLSMLQSDTEAGNSSQATQVECSALPKMEQLITLGMLNEQGWEGVGGGEGWDLLLILTPHPQKAKN